MRALLARTVRIVRRDTKKAARTATTSISRMEALEDRQLLTTYYVSPSGSDSKSGTSTTSAWRSISRVNSQTLRAGDKVLFQGGASFSGSVYLPSTEAGTSTAPITFSTYGTGRATINSGSSRAFDMAQHAGIVISNFNLRGNGMYNNRSPGIDFHLDWSNRRANFIRIDNVDVSGYGDYNIRVWAGGAGSGFSDVKITNSTVHDSRKGGIDFHATSPRIHKNVYIANVKAYNHPGTGSSTEVTGNGIFFSNIDGGIVERSVAYNNGANGHAPVGIWSSFSNRVTFQYNESYANKTRSDSDGGGFDFDWEMTNSVMQYNYSHDNHGPGYLLGAGTHKNDSNIIRYNISQNDGRKNARSSIQLWGNVTNAKIYNNVLYMSNSPSSPAIFAHNAGVTNTIRYTDIRNNIIIATGGSPLIKATSAFTNSTNRVVGNAYWGGGSSFKIYWGSSTVTSIDGFRSKGQEKLNGVNTGYWGDPKLAAAGKAGTLNNAYNLKTLTQYKLQSTSPLINRGLAPASTLSASTSDFFGGTLPKSGKYDIGCHEAA